jgi:hypothetical protein
MSFATLRTFPRPSVRASEAKQSRVRWELWTYVASRPATTDQSPLPHAFNGTLAVSGVASTATALSSDSAMM